MSYEPSDNSGDSELRRRAAWLLVLLVLVAALVVTVMVTLLDTSGNGGSGAADIDGPSITPTAPTSQSGSGSDTGKTKRTSGRANSGGSDDTSGAESTPAANPGGRHRASCPTSAACNVDGDVAGAAAAINALRADHHQKPVDTQVTAAAEKCALTSGNKCPASFVWVRVDGLSGNDLVDGVVRFHSGDDLLDPKAKSFEVGWAYDPKTHTSTAAVIRNP